MAKKPDAKGGNGDIIYTSTGTARKYLRNTSSPDKVLRFKRELEVLQEMCKNPISNIVEVVDVHWGESKSDPSYVEMKKYDGSLYQILQVTKGNVRKSLELILPIIKALHTLSVGSPPLYHRDIKPDNILFLADNESYTLYLTDFGTCYLNDGSERLTPETMAVGPRMYIAPEYETGRVEDVTEKGDIFSIGKVIWCMINGEEDAFMPSNFWFVDEYDLTNRYPDNADMLVANSIIASCLSINPDERCSYSELIGQIESYIDTGIMTVEKEAQYKVKLYQEKRKIELQEIQEKNRLLVNRFSHCYLDALKELTKNYPGFELMQELHAGYLKKIPSGTDHSTVVKNLISGSLIYHLSTDGISLSIRFEAPEGNERFAHISIAYKVSTAAKWNHITIKYDSHGVLVCQHYDQVAQLSENTLYSCFNTLIMEYIQ